MLEYMISRNSTDIYVYISLLFPVPDKMSQALEEWLTANKPKVSHWQVPHLKRDLHCQETQGHKKMATPTIPLLEHFDLSTENFEANLGQQHWMLQYGDVQMKATEKALFEQLPLGRNAQLFAIGSTDLSTEHD